MMINRNVARFFHFSATRLAAGANKSNLAKLRKKTGYPFGNCKKALEVNNNDLVKAEKWLEEQAKALGWSKAMKMENRSTLQGLVGIAWDKQYAAMVEVNCETDFVGRNEKFQKLVDLVAKTCLLHTQKESSSTKTIGKVMLDGAEMGRLLASDQQSLGDHVVKGVAVVGEKLVLRRAALVNCPVSSDLSAFTHPTPTTPGSCCLLGKYGTVMIYSSSKNKEKSAHLAKQLCQHVIGMNPSTIEVTEEDLKKKSLPAKEKPVVASEEDGEAGGLVVREEEEDETAMMQQTFLLDPERTVADVVAEAGLRVEDFVRFECGEGLIEVEEVVNKVAQVGG